MSKSIGIIFFILFTSVLFGQDKKIRIHFIDVHGNPIESDIQVINIVKSEKRLLGRTSSGTILISKPKDQSIIHLEFVDSEGLYKIRNKTIDVKKTKLFEISIELYYSNRKANQIAKHRDFYYDSLDNANSINSEFTSKVDTTNCSFEDLFEEKMDLFFSHWLSELIQYPPESLVLGNQGRVYVKYVIHPDGVISHAKIERGIDEWIDNEVLALIYSLPSLTPKITATCKKKITVRMPVNFYLH